MKTMLVIFMALSLVLAPYASLVNAETSPFSNAAAQTFSQAELDQMLASIALYPDSLLAQVLVAAGYPAQVVQAD